MATDTVILRNENWNLINVEVRRGNLEDIESNPLLGCSLLSNNEDWTIESDSENIFYRRDSDPDPPDGTWTEWTERACFGLGETFLERI